MDELCADMIVNLIGIIVTCTLLMLCGGSVWLHGVTKALCVNGGGVGHYGAVHQVSKLMAGQREKIVKKNHYLGTHELKLLLSDAQDWR